MSSADDSKEGDLLPFLTKVKEEDRLTWEEFGNEDWDKLEVVCETNWKLDEFQTTKVKTIWKNHPANQKASQQQGK